MTEPDRGHNERNESSRRRLVDLASRLGADELALEIDDTWTVGALLGHLAFWDRLVEARWKLAQASGTATPIGLEDELVDIINDAAIPAWRIVDPRRLGTLVVTAAGDVDALIAAIPSESVDAVLAERRPRLLDRSRHRELHLATIEARLSA